MTAVPRLLAEYIEQHRSGAEPDPVAFLDRAPPNRQRELAALIDAYLARAPRRAFDEAAFRSSSAPATVDELQRTVIGASGLWPVVLPRLRRRAGMKRRELVLQLAQALGVSAKSEKVERYYHEMEQGLLPARGVSDRVLDALATLVGSSADRLRAAGEAATRAMGEAQPGQAFARTVQVDEALAQRFRIAAPAEEPHDEVDELFRGSA